MPCAKDYFGGSPPGERPSGPPTRNGGGRQELFYRQGIPYHPDEGKIGAGDLFPEESDLFRGPCRAHCQQAGRETVDGHQVLRNDGYAHDVTVRHA